LSKQEFKSATELKTVAALWMVSAANTATTVKRKLEIKEVDGEWKMIFSDPANVSTDPTEIET